MEVYLDNSATTKCLDSVVQMMNGIYLKDYGNPSSMHMKGVDAERYLRYARETIAKNLKVFTKENKGRSEIIFTSGGTESDNLALIGTALANQRNGKHLIATKIEHPAILRTMNYLESIGFRVSYLSVDRQGKISLEELERQLTPDTTLVSIMHTNNEIGTIQPIAEAGALIKSIRPTAVFHVDAVQGYGKFHIYPRKMGIDLMSVSGHKIHGPKGVGFLYANEKIKLSPIVYGGGQQEGMRSGTENVPGIAGMAKAVEEIYADLDQEVARMYALKQYFTQGLEALDGVRINGAREQGGAPHIISASVKGVRAEVLLHALEERGIYVSAGSACAANKHTASATLMAIGMEKEYLDATLRFSMSVFTTKKELTYTLKAIEELLPILRKYTRR